MFGNLTCPFYVCYSVGEYETYINESSGFLFYGMERFSGYLPPFKIAALNLIGEYWTFL